MYNFLFHFFVNFDFVTESEANAMKAVERRNKRFKFKKNLSMSESNETAMEDTELKPLSVSKFSEKNFYFVFR